MQVLTELTLLLSSSISYLTTTVNVSDAVLPSGPVTLNVRWYVPGAITLIAPSIAIDEAFSLDLM